MNTPMVGALIRLLDGVKLEALQEAVMERFKGRAGEKNANAVKVAYEKVKL